MEIEIEIDHEKDDCLDCRLGRVPLPSDIISHLLQIIIIIMAIVVVVVVVVEGSPSPVDLFFRLFGMDLSLSIVDVDFVLASLINLLMEMHIATR